MLRFLAILLMCVTAAPAHGQDAKQPTSADILIADFEGDDYGAWKTTGTAFGAGPARGTLPGQMPVTGFLGKGLVNSFHGGDASTGTLTSPTFQIERSYLNFLIGGGKYPGKTCINLLVAGKVVRTATGPNDQPGGSEQLDWHTWDVRALLGKEAVLEIVDQATGGWGHINVDHIVQSNRQRGAALARRELEITQRYLHLPVQTGAAKKRVKLFVADQAVREFEIELADVKPDFWAPCDVSPWLGKKLTVESMLPADSTALSRITAADDEPDAVSRYRETLRPQFHFTSRRGWLNDPNGLVYANGEYHLFYQHNPYGWNWGNMHWGHAVSADLLHWKEVGIALYPRHFGDWCFSGSAVVDKQNTSGWKKSANDLLVAAFTSTGRGECIVYSNDRGRTWSEFEGNPVVKHRGRDPRLLWHEPTKRWVMAVYDEEEGKKIAFYSSENFKEWTLHSRIGEFYECPDLFALPADGDPKKTKWVLYGADGKYLLGDFDGRKFTPETKLLQVWYGNMYAAQTFSDVPDGRRIQMGWARIDFKGMPFNQQMTVPCELTLRSTEGGVRMFVQPVREMDKLCTPDLGMPGKNESLVPGSGIGTLGKYEPFRLRTEIELRGAARVIVQICDAEIVIDTANKRITYGHTRTPLSLQHAEIKAPLILQKGGTVHLEVLLDGASTDIFVNRGQTAMSARTKSWPNNSINFYAEGGTAKVISYNVDTVRSIWKK